MSSSRLLFHTGNSAFQRAGRVSSSYPAWASPTSRRSWSPQTCGGSSWTIMEMEEMSKGEILLSDACPLFCSVFVCYCSFIDGLCWCIGVCVYVFPHTDVTWIKLSVLSSVRKTERKRTRTTEHKELAVCPSPHIWCAGAGSGLGRRSDQPNEISQHTKCLSGPIRIPSCLPWVYLIDGKPKERSPLWVGSLVPRVGLAWAGLGWVGPVWVGLGWVQLGWDGFDWACQAL